MRHLPLLIVINGKLRGTPMADDDLTNARKVLAEMRHIWIKTIADGYKRGTTEDAIKGLIDAQQAIEVIDIAIEEELEEAEELEEEDDE
jgi:hypothetical protein